MTKDEALKLALEALDRADKLFGSDASDIKAMTAIREALAQPPVAKPHEQEPVYKYCTDGKVIFTNPEILSQRPNKEKNT